MVFFRGLRATCNYVIAGEEDLKIGEETGGGGCEYDGAEVKLARIALGRGV